MTQKEKDLLLRDLSARLTCRTMVKCKTDYRHEFDEELSVVHIMNFYQFDVKPYLRPMSSMTEEEVFEYLSVCNKDNKDTLTAPKYLGLDYLLSHHFDYRGLIEKGLALEAPEGMYN